MSDEYPHLPRISGYKPQYLELERGKSYLWCSCGLSKSQPFCDQSHRGTGFKPIRYIAKEQGEEVLFCNCKYTNDGPFCDGSHNNLRDVYEQDDPDSEKNRAIPFVNAGLDGRVVLDGGCYISNVDKILLAEYGTLRIAPVISGATGASYQSQFYAEAGQGQSPIMGFGTKHAVILVTEGSGEVCISGQFFPVTADTGLYVRPDEAFSLHNASANSLKLFVSVSPIAERPEILCVMPDTFDHDFPVRTVGVDPVNRQTMADRFFQVLVDKRIGSTIITQFIGEVPLSKAAPHRHLYEESIVVLRGAGCMWTERGKAPVVAGDVIFLPRKQIHSLECTDPEGMMLAGVICPGDNPSINY